MGARLQSRPCQVQMQASLPSGSARIQNAGAALSETSVPPAAIAAAIRCCGDIVRNGDVEVDAVALRSWRVHLLEPERRGAAVGILAVVVEMRFVAEHRLPEGLDRRDVERIDRDLELGDGGRFRRDVELGGDSRDRAGHLDIPDRHAICVVGREEDVDTRIGDREVGMVVRGVGGDADACCELDAFGEPPGVERRLQRAQQHPPVLQPFTLADLR